MAIERKINRGLSKKALAGAAAARRVGDGDAILAGFSQGLMGRE